MAEGHPGPGRGGGLRRLHKVFMRARWVDGLECL